MNAITINRLHLRAERDAHIGARFAVEEALRISSVTDRRLLLIRSMSIGRVARKHAPIRIASHVTRQYDEASARALHGNHRDAPMADAVWFRDVEEAHAIFLAWSATGRSTSAWYWQLLLKHPCYHDPVQWVEMRLKHIQRDRSTAASLVHSIFEALAHVEALPMLRLLAKSALGKTPYSTARSDIDPGSSPAAAYPVSQLAQPDISASRKRRLVKLIAVALGKKPSRALLLAALDHREAPELMVAAAWLVLMREKPDLAARASELEQLSGEMAAIMRSEEWLPPTLPTKQSDAQRNPSKHTGTSPERDCIERPAKAPIEPELRAAAHAELDLEGPKTTQDPSRDAVGDTEHYLAGAGLFLVLPTLRRLGFGDWLAARPDYQIDDFAQRFILYLAGCSSKAEAPTFALALGIEDWQSRESPSEEMASEFRLWRAAIDGWMKRKTKRRLHDLAERTGWFAFYAGKLRIRYPAGDADIALRRHALDVDPGWVDWLGISVRYRFQDEPLS